MNLRDIEIDVSVTVPLDTLPDVRKAVEVGEILGSLYKDGEVWANPESLKDWLAKRT